MRPRHHLSETIITEILTFCKSSPLDTTNTMTGMTPHSNDSTVSMHETSPHTTTWLRALSSAWLINIFTTVQAVCTELCSMSTNGTLLTHDQTVYSPALRAVLKLLTQLVSTSCRVCHATFRCGSGKTSEPSSRLATATRDGHRPPTMMILSGLSASSCIGNSLHDVNTSRISLSAMKPHFTDTAVMPSISTSTQEILNTTTSYVKAQICHINVLVTGQEVNVCR